MGSLTADDIRQKLGLRPAPTSNGRGAGKTTEMLIRALEDADKGNVVHIICHDFSFCGHLKSVATEYAKTLKIDSKLLQFVPASSAGRQLLGNHKLHLYVDHWVRENGMFDDYELQGLMNYAEPASD